MLAAPSFLFALESNDPLYDELWYLENIDAPGAWDTATGSKEIVVAVLDAGIDLDHPDLKGNLWKNTGEIANNGVDDDGNGYIDDVNGWDFVGDDNDTNPDTGPGSDEEAIAHGSLISGIIGAIGDNAEGVVGVNWEVLMMPIRMLDKVGSGNSTDAADAIDYAVANGAKVINLSFSGNENDPRLGRAVENAYDAGVVIVAAMGNENRDTGEESVYPACYGENGEDWVIGVGATNQIDKKAQFSNYGDCVDISAPGTAIFGVSYLDEDEGLPAYQGEWSGTSMAAPMVSGAAALVLSVYPNLTPEEVGNVLKLSVDPLSLGPTFQGEMGSGKLNVSRALEIASEFAAAHGEEEEVESAQNENGIQVGDVVTSDVASSVYYISQPGERRPFINEAAYFTHFDSFDAIETVENDVFSDFALTGLMLPKAGVVLVKIQSDPRVYALEENPSDAFAPRLREIATEEIAVQMYGENWADFVIDIEPTFFTRFAKGDIITSPIPVDTSIMKTRDQLAQLAQ